MAWCFRWPPAPPPSALTTNLATKSSLNKPLPSLPTSSDSQLRRHGHDYSFLSFYSHHFTQHSLPVCLLYPSSPISCTPPTSSAFLLSSSPDPASSSDGGGGLDDEFAAMHLSYYQREALSGVARMLVHRLQRSTHNESLTTVLRISASCPLLEEVCMSVLCLEFFFPCSGFCFEFSLSAAALFHHTHELYRPWHLFGQQTR